MANLMAACEPSLPLPEGGYVRTFAAEIDNHSDSTIRIHGVLSDHRCALEHDWVLHIPEYEIIQASARHLSGEPTVLSPALIARYPAIRGARPGGGFTQTMREVLGDLPGHQDHLLLAIEMARISIQGYPVPKGDHERFRPLVAAMPPGPSRLARMSWERDRVDWPSICNSCYTYRVKSMKLHFRLIEIRKVRQTTPRPLVNPLCQTLR